MSSIAIKSHTRLIAPETLCIFAQSLALSCSITIGNSRQIDIPIGISSHKIKNISATATTLINLIAFPTSPSGITLNNKMNTLKKSEIESKTMKKAFRNDPPATLPQFLHNKRVKEWQQ